jgi:hypothetical protein
MLRTDLCHRGSRHVVRCLTTRTTALCLHRHRKGRSQPEAQLKSLYGLTGACAGLFREGSEVADISCTVEAGAATTVKEPDKGAVRFGKYVDLANVFRPEPATAEG